MMGSAMGKVKGFLSSKNRRKLWDFLNALPIVLPVSLSGFSIIAMIFLVANNFDAKYVLPVGVAVATGLGYLAYRYYPKGSLSKEVKLSLVVIFGVVIVWTIFNGMLSSQHVHVNRDPAVYAVAGLRLADENDLMFPQNGILSGIEGVTEASAGFGPNASYPGTLYAQGAHLLPALLGLAGKVGGDNFLLHFNVVFGALAILAVFAFARLLMKERWALVAAIAFACCMPLIYFSRDTYTEPLSAVFVFGALALVALADKQRSLLLWLLAGLVAGSVSLARVDATLTLAGLVFGVVVFALIAKSDERKKALLSLALFVVPVIGVSMLAWLDWYLLSRGYYEDLSSEIALLYMLFATVVAVGIVAIIIGWKTNLLGWLQKVTQGWRGKTVVAIVVVASLALVSRPLWFEGHLGGPIGLVGSIQQATGAPVDPTRDYSEHTISWMAWYIGPVLLTFSVVGFSIAAYRALYSRSVVWITSMAVIFAVAMLYLNKPSITPDQIWAARRFLPVVIPGIAVFGALGLAWLYEQRPRFGISWKGVATVLAPISIMLPLMVSYPLVVTRTYETQFTQINEVCSAIKDKENTIILWGGTASLMLIQPVNAVCGVASFRNINDDTLRDKEHLKEIAQQANKKGYKLVLGMFKQQIGAIVAGDRHKLIPVSHGGFFDYEQTLERPPVRPQYTDRTILFANITADGELEKFR